VKNGKASSGEGAESSKDEGKDDGNAEGEAMTPEKKPKMLEGRKNRADGNEPGHIAGETEAEHYTRLLPYHHYSENTDV